MRSRRLALATSLLALGLGHRAVAAPDSQPRPIGDAALGKTFFLSNCAICHATGTDARPQSGQGPLLAGVVGRRAAALADFTYSPALTASRLTWDDATLDRYLANPTQLVPGTNMLVVVPQPSDRQNLIAFLATLRPLAPATKAATTPATPRVPGPGDWQHDRPGVRHRIRPEDLPPPYATRSVGNAPRVVARPAHAALAVPPGFQVKLFAAGLSAPRLLRTAPNGDLFIAETRAGRIRVLRAADGAEAPTENAVFADKLRGPFGIAFYPVTGEPRWVYVATLNAVLRFPYRNGDLQARAPAETVLPELSGTTGGHTTRDVVFSADGRQMFISVGSASNVADKLPPKKPEEIRAWEASHARGAAWDYETHRANVLVADPEGNGLRIFATGIRNAVSLAVQTDTGALWASNNERDALGDDLVPDYITRVRDSGFYGWPWYYIGNHEDPRHAGKRPDLAGQAIVPDVLLQAHSAVLQIAFYPAAPTGPSAFPAEYRGDIFAASHGSWNRTGRTGYKVIRVRLRDGVPTGDYEDFLTGFVIDDAQVWGRPVGVTIARDGALLVSDDGNGTLWRVAYVGQP